MLQETSVFSKAADPGLQQYMSRYIPLQSGGNAYTDIRTLLAQSASAPAALG